MRLKRTSNDSGLWARFAITFALLWCVGCRLGASSATDLSAFRPDTRDAGARLGEDFVANPAVTAVSAVDASTVQAAQAAGVAPPTNNAPLDAGAGDARASSIAETAWTPGNYPDDLMSENFLKISDLNGQRGFVRQYKVHVPTSYRPDRPMPLVFCLHGLFQGTTMFCVSGSGLLELSDQQSFIVAMPVGYSGSWNAGRCCGDARDMKLDDVAFIRGVFEELKRHLNIALDRVFAIGFANGGFMTYRLACEAADIFSAMVVGSGGLGINAFQDVSASNPDLLISQSDFEQCQPSRPVSMLHIHGSLDELVPQSLQPESLSRLAVAAGCSSTTSIVADRTQRDTSCSTYNACPDGIEIAGCTVDGGGHCWFGQEDCGTGAGVIGALFTGANSSVMRNSAAAVEFLRAHGL